MIKPLDWGTFFDKKGVPHVIPLYEEGKPQPGHIIDIKCNCATQVRSFPTRVVIIHRVIH